MCAGWTGEYIFSVFAYFGFNFYKLVFKGKFISIHEIFLILDSPRTSIFLEELNEAVRPLQDYGISVTKVESYNISNTIVTNIFNCVT